MADVTSLNVRRGNKAYVTKILNKTKVLIGDLGDENRTELEGIKITLTEKMETLKQLDDKILANSKSEEDICTEIEKSSDFRLKIQKTVIKIDTVLKPSVIKSSNESFSENLANMTNSLYLSSNGKLPSLNIKPFYGNL